MCSTNIRGTSVSIFCVSGFSQWGCCGSNSGNCYSVEQPPRTEQPFRKTVGRVGGGATAAVRDGSAGGKQKTDGFIAERYLISFHSWKFSRELVVDPIYPSGNSAINN